MLTIIYNHKRLRINLHRLFSALMCFVLVVACVGVAVDFCRYPEKHLTTWRYQLYNEIKAGKTESIDYYNKHYTSKGIYLYGEDKTEVLNLATVTGYEATAEGVLLHTADGNGYFIEK